MKKYLKGISLIVLIITIIIMIIIAGAIVLTLNSSGIISKAHTAKKSVNYKTAKELVLVEKSNYEIRKRTSKGEEIGDFSEYAENKLIEAGYPENGEGSYRVSEDGDLVVIPKGFMASEIEGETKVEEGLVIYEGLDKVTSVDADENGIIDAQENRNQYVWVPVPNISEFVRRDGYYQGTLQTFVSAGTTREPVNYTDDWTKEVAEYNKMYNSVKKYGGFYIARYEAGSETKRTNTANGTTTLVASKKDKYPYNYVGWGKNEWNINGDVTHGGNNQGKGAVALSRSVYPEDSDYGVVSTLIYGVEWDAVVKIYSDSGINIKSNSSMGYYAYQSTDDQNPNYKTGIDLTVGGKTGRNKLKNIYDMAGNMFEWTMENGISGCRVKRGGAYNLTGYNNPVSNRNENSPAGYTYAQTGFRIALYLK